MQEENTMSSPKIVDGKVTVFLTLSAEYTNAETDPMDSVVVQRFVHDLRLVLHTLLGQAWELSES
jgi:hypothetical protein